MNRRVSTNELLALFNMSQQLAPFGLYSFGLWERHLEYMNTAPAGSLIPYQNYSFVNYPEVLHKSKTQPLIFVTLHMGSRFADGIAETTRRIHRSNAGLKHLAIVGGLSADPHYGVYYSPLSDPDVRNDYPVRIAGINDPGFSRTVVKHLRLGGVLYVAVDANGGRGGGKIDAPFLRNGLSLRAGVFAAASSLGAVVVPLVTDYEAQTLYFGSILSASRLRTEELAAGCLSFFEPHVARSPERWTRWSHYHLLAASAANPVLSSDPDGGNDQPEWIFTSDEVRPLALQVNTWKLFDLDPPALQRFEATVG